MTIDKSRQRLVPWTFAIFCIALGGLSVEIANVISAAWGVAPVAKWLIDASALGCEAVILIGLSTITEKLAVRLCSPAQETEAP